MISLVSMLGYYNITSQDITSLFFLTIGCHFESSCDASRYDTSRCNYGNTSLQHILTNQITPCPLDDQVKVVLIDDHLTSV